MIKIEHINKDEALRYLACQDTSTIGKAALEYMDECEKRLLDTIAPKFIYRCFEISRTDGKTGLQGAINVLSGNDIAEHLNGCDKAVIMAATLGSGADSLIRRLQIEDMAKAVIADAFASAAIEQVCEQAEEIIRTELGTDCYTWRYSPGYGDFPLDMQRPLLDLLNAPKKIGLCVLDSGLMTPIKSVTAVIGVSDSPLPKKARGCGCCNMKDICQFRKRGLHCGL